MIMVLQFETASATATSKGTGSLDNVRSGVLVIPFQSAKPHGVPSVITRQVAEKTGADWVLYQELGDLVDAVREVNPDIVGFDSSCFK